MTAAYNLFAYRKDHQGDDLRRDGIPEWNRDQAVAWAFNRGCDTVLIELADRPATGIPGVTAHVDCADPTCPGGC